MPSVNLKVIDFVNSSSISNESVSFEVENLSHASIAYALNWQRARKRSGSASTKIMSEISGTTAKPHKQKGTGRARQGSRRSVQFVGGRACFGPRPRSFDYALPKKIFSKALSDSLKLKISEGLLVFADSASDVKKTSQVNKILSNNKMTSCLFICNSESFDQGLAKAIKNIKGSKVLDSKAINVYDLLKYRFVIVEKSLLNVIKQMVG